ncbi:ABC transporter substrate-binding protein [Azospirillum rugosum]|uniref:Spermidine/putrescine transport system substrate-binding protein n=1 Tax=Azospirillum rugosum TaxID=416170 RepID=A0ABS4SWQ3_9PROT|nr:ABC transporter substrate-binding protein [Azospirillum rugosum]MBP2296988.1 putative spermidine/putrescine transport system substrate-binding protein [Azospirillum rugosum]MDQ0530620.1 putative spermidine/putrescine transport system substrate-binding protein [Azospirillum rugosum]
MRALVYGLMATAAVWCGTAQAQQKTLYVAAYGGSFEQTMRKDVIPPFEQKTGVKIEYVAGNSTDNLAKLQAQKGNQQIDVVMLDDGPMYQAVALGFCSDLAKAPIYDDLYDLARIPSGKAVNFGAVGTGIVYNKKVFDENKWPAPSSWKDIEDAKFKKKLVVPPINNSYGLHALVMMARLNGGGEKNIDPGFKEFKDKVNPNVLAYEPSPGKMTELFQSGQADIAVWGSGRAKALADTGFPAAFVYPKEGGIVLASAACQIAGSKQAAEAQQFIQHMLTPEVQTAMAVSAGFGPVNKKVTLSPEQQTGIPYGPEQMGKLLVVDWDTINANREAWNKRWTREIER